VILSLYIGLLAKFICVMCSDLRNCSNYKSFYINLGKFAKINSSIMEKLERKKIIEFICELIIVNC